LDVGGVVQKIFEGVHSVEMLLLLKPILQLSEHKVSKTFEMQAADKCKINYSTAKIILKEVSNQEKKYIKRLVRKKEKDEKEGMDQLTVCNYV
jgi:hypothetical protein